MLFLFVIPLCIAFLPWVLVKYVFATPQSARLSYTGSLPWLGTAAVLWDVAFFLPNIPISTDTTTFTQHAMGGVVAAVLFWYVCHAYQLRFTYWWQLPWALFFFVSGLGVLNELFELLLAVTGIFLIDSSDVWWDLLANTIGAFVALSLYALGRQPQSYSTQHHL